MNDKLTLVPYNRALEPASQEQAKSLAVDLAKIGLCGCKSPVDALTRILTGRELGLSAMQAMRGIYVVDGKPALDAGLMHSLCLQSPECERFDCIEQSDASVTYLVKRKGRQEIRVTWTMDDAKRAGLVGKQNWTKFPRQMLHARAKAEAARMVFPDKLFGLYSPEELSDGAYATVAQVETSVRVEERPSPALKLIERIESADAGDKNAVLVEIQKAKRERTLTDEELDAVRAAYGARFVSKAKVADVSSLEVARVEVVEQAEATEYDDAS